MEYDFFAQSMAEICGHSLVSPGRPLACTVIVNPAAGGFTIRSRWKSHVKTLNEYRQKARANPPREMSKDVRSILTEGKGSGEKITKTIIDEAENDPSPFYLIITAGGDGTSLEVMLALYNAPAHVRSNMAVLRLPMGTGNDGADCAWGSAHLGDALELLVKPVHTEFAPAIQLITARGGHCPLLAFNILSIGLDAYVTHMTNKMKGKVPGDSYKLWVDIAALFYDRIYKVDYLDIRALDDQNREIRAFREKMLLLAMGVSGYRTYGSQKRILPDDRNVCGIRQMPLHRKLAIKNQVAKGTHPGSPEPVLFNAHRLEFSGSHPILAQMDGETVLLQVEDFPAAMELTAPVIPLLKLL
ncbi:MAG: diacylglycerol kinase [Treponema sp.]|jgi:diacylglycerol kinase family enzyme|nr:diacylglycerol kinase [Treponema sp.]